jgi:hypothetical protein
LIEDFPRNFFLPFVVSLSFAVAFPAVVRPRVVTSARAGARTS